MPPRNKAKTAPTPAVAVNVEGGPRSAAGSAFAAFDKKFDARFAAAGATLASKLISPEIFSTGSISLDYALRVGGLPRGRLITSQGPSDIGKTTLSMLMVASAQRAYPNQRATWVDPEATFDPNWAGTLGVDLDRLKIVPKPDTAEEVADAVFTAVESGFNSIVVLDSVGAMLGRAEKEAMAEEAKVALIARIMTRLSKQVVGVGARNGTVTKMVNQVRSTISSTAHAGATTSTGGNALRHMASIQLLLARGYDDDAVRKLLVDGVHEEVGYQMKVTVAKNKMAPRGPVAEVWIYNRPTAQFGPAGIGVAEEALTFGLRLGGVEQKGSWYVTPDGEQHQGRAAAATHLRANPHQIEDIRTRAIASLAHEPGKLPAGQTEADLIETLPAGTED